MPEDVELPDCEHVEADNQGGEDDLSSSPSTSKSGNDGQSDNEEAEEEELSTSDDDSAEDNTEAETDNLIPVETSTNGASSSKSESANETTAPTTSAAFSVAQALSMIRQKREKEQEVAKVKEQELEAQRLEKAREKRRRRRRNQKLRKASLKLNEGTGVVEDSASFHSGQADGEPLEADDGQAGDEQSRRGESSKPKRGADDEEDETLLKKLPVKKRIKLASTQPSISTNAKSLDSPTTSHTNAHAKAEPLPPPSKSACDNQAASSSSAQPRINRLIPRALMLKKSLSARDSSKSLAK